MIIHSIALLLVSITFACAEESAPSNVADKRGSSMGFQGMRGKKEFDSSLYDQLSKRAPMGFQGMRGKKNSIVGNELLPEGTNKRAPMGFQGMRGKKNGLMGDLEDSSFLYDDYEKRAPMGFQGMRGKKSSPEDGYYKRAPMGFQGMRGKKSLDEILEEIRKRTVTRFPDPREEYLIDYPEDLADRGTWSTVYQSICDKNEDIAGASAGFQESRGNRIILDALEELEKRTDMDFHGLRGKKDPFDNYFDYSITPSDYEKRAVDLQDSEGSESFKRARIGFHGMRGKRDAAQIYGSNSSNARTTMGYRQGISNRGNELAAYEIDKRSPFRYLGVRGKKNPRWEFRGKFVGVRGKKSSSPLQTTEQGQAVF